MNNGKRIELLLASQHALLREAIHSALDNEPDIHVVAETRPGMHTVAEAERARPDVAVLEVDGLSGECMRTIALLRQRAEDCRILLLAEGEDVDLLIDGLEAGAQGYVSKESPLSELVDATRAIADGELVIPPGMLKRLIIRLVQRRKDRQEGADRMAKLTQRELEVLKLLATGADNEGIGRALVISPQTARTHIQNILSKLGAHSRLEAVAFVRGSGILDDAREPAGGGTADEMLEGPAVSRVGRVSERQAG